MAREDILSAARDTEEPHASCLNRAPQPITEKESPGFDRDQWGLRPRASSRTMCCVGALTPWAPFIPRGKRRNLETDRSRGGSS